MFFLKDSLNLYAGLTFADMTGRSLRCIVFVLAGGLLGFTLYELCVSVRLLVVGFCVVTVVGFLVVTVVVVGAFVVDFAVVLEGVVTFCVVDVVVVLGCEVVGFVEDSVEGTVVALVTATGFSVFAGVKGE